MRIVSVTILFAGLFAGLCLGAIKIVTPKIALSLQTDITEQLTNQTYTSIDVSVDGRDVTLAGQVVSQENINQAIKIASHRPGVRIVMHKINIAERQSE